MFFRRQTLLAGLLLPLSLYAQPVANDDDATVSEGQSISINLVENDTPDPGVDPSTIDLDPDTPGEDKSISNPAGNFTVSNAGILDYTPTADYDEAAVITYTVKDAALLLSDPATVTINVTPVNDAPTIGSISNTSVNEDGTTPEIPFVVGDVDNDYAELTVSALSSDLTLIPASGIVTDGNNGNRTIVITPAAGESGTATITVTVRDPDLLSAESTFDIEVIAAPALPPVIAISEAITTAEDTPGDPVTITVTDADTPVENLTLNANSANTTLIPAANVSLVPGVPGTWTLSVTPAADQNGTTQINLVASDGTGNTDSDPVGVTVTAVNDPPTIETIDDQTIPQGGTTGPIGFTIGDVDGFTGVTVSAVSDNAALVLPGGIVLGGSNGSRTIAVTPVSSASGTATITVTVSDGGPITATEEFIVDVTPTPVLPPVITISQAIVTLEDTPGGPVTITVADGDTPAANLTLTATSANTTLIPAANISLVPGAPGTWTLSVTPATDRNGATQINLLASDGTGNTDSDPVSVTVTAVNDPPTIATIDDQTIPQGGTTGPISFTIGDVDGFTGVTVSAVSNNAALVLPGGIALGGSNGSRTIAVTPVSSASGAATITVTVSDGGPVTATEEFIVDVTPTPTLPPVIAISGAIVTTEDTPGNPVTITVADGDTPAASLTLIASSANTTLIPAANVSLVPGAPGTWTLSVTPATNRNGTTQINLLASDNTGNTDSDPVSVTVTAVNDLPSIAAIGNQSINQNTSTPSLSFTIGDLETDPTALVMSASSSNTTLVPESSIVFGGNGSNRNVTVTATPGLFGTTTITLTVTDADLGERQTSFLLTVLEVNDPPFFVTSFSNRTIDEDMATGSLPFTVGDPNTPLTALVVTGRSSNTGLVDLGGIAIGGADANRSVTITPNINANGVTNITLRVSDGALFTETSFVLTVNSINDPPTITSISTQNIDENTSTGPLGFTVTDLETMPTLLTMSSLSSNSSLADQAEIVFDGLGSARSVNVFPKINRSGAATITLTVTDANGGTAQTAFLLNVAAVDAPPTISTINDFSLNEDTPSLPIPFTVDDIDVPAEDLTVTSSSSATSVVASGGVALVETGPGAWTVRITPVLNASGSSVITLTVDDGTETSTETFTVTVNAVNDLPTITPLIPTQSINEGSSTGAINFAISDVETAAGSLNVTTSSSDESLVPPGNIVVSGLGGSRTITVTPVPDGFGSADITIHVTDASTGETTQTFTVNVAPVNDAPTISTILAQNINEDQAGGTGDLPFTVEDKEAGTLTVTGSSSNQTVVPNENITVSGSGTSRTVRVVPANNAFGTAIITLTVTDPDELSGTSTFNVVVASINDAPTVSTPPDQTIAENASTGAIPFTVGDIETAAGSLNVTRASSNAALIPLANVVLGGSGTNRTVAVSPLASQSGTSTITLTVTDGTTPVSTTFDVVVTAVEDPPTISNIADLAVNEDNATSAIPFTITDPDTPAGSLGVTATSDNQSLAPDVNVVLGGSGGSRSVTVTPLTNQNGSATITITVTDGTNVLTETFVLTVTPVNDAPTITAIANQTTNEDTPTGNIGFTVADLETPVAGLTVTATSDNPTLVPNAPANLELGGTEASRTIRVTPANDASGTANVTVRVDDGTTTATRTFSVTVLPMNDEPTISVIADQTVTEDAGTGAIAFTIGDQETPVGSLGLTVSSSNTTLVPVANAVLGGSGANRTVTVTPAFNQNGTTIISITVDDGNTATVRDFVVTVSPVNDAPTVSTITNRTINEDIPTGNISFTISDPETPASDLSVTAESDNGTLVPPANILLGGTTGTRTINIIPAADLSGTAVITIHVSDLTNTTSRSFTVNVTPVNDLPKIEGQEVISVNEGVAVTLDFVLLHVVDPDNDVSQLTLLPTGGANYSLTGPTTITPNAFYYGPLTVPVLVSDGSGVGPLFNVAITVISTNDPPVITGQPTAITMDEDQTYTIPLGPFTITDPDSDPGARTLTVLPGTNYTVSNGNQITPLANVNGTLTVSVIVNDGQADSAPFNATVTVNPINDPPTITAQTSISTNEETELTINSGQFTITDPEPTSYTITVLPPAADAPYVIVSGSTIKPKADVTGTITVPVRANDGQANSAVFDAQVSIVPVNDPPVITGQTSLTTVEDIPITVKLEDLVVTDVDNTAYPAGFTMTVLPGTDYTFTVTTITPSLDFVGTLSVNVQVSDGLASSNIYPLLITVTDDADAPTINGQQAISMLEDTQREIKAADLIIADSDTSPADQVPSILAGTNYTFEGATVIPNPNFYGTLTVNVRVFDGEAYSNTFPLQVTVTSVDDAASFNSIANITVFEDAPQQSFTVMGITAGPGESNPNMTFTLVSDNTGLIPHPNTLPRYSNGAATAVVVYKPNPNEFGIATVTATLVDTPPGVEKKFTITVTPVNDPPTLAAIEDREMPEGTSAQTVTLSGISPGGGQPEAGQTLSFIVSTDNDDLFEIVPQAENPAPGQTTAVLNFKAKEDAFGTANITVRLQDSGQGSPAPNVNFIEQTFTLEITPVNDPPMIVSTPNGVAEPGKEYVYELIVVDADGDDLVISASSLPSWATLVQGANGRATISGVPPASEPGKSVRVEILVTDEAGVTADASYDLTVNSRPILANIILGISEDSQLPLAGSDFDPAGFDDPEGNPLAEMQILTLPLHGILKTATGTVSPGAKFAVDQISTLVYEPQENFFGTDSLRWTAADGFMLYAENPTGALLTIQVAPVNDLPVFTMEAQTDTLKYELGSEERVRLTRLFDCWDPDGDLIRSAELIFSGIDGFQYRPENDFLIFTSTPKITGTFNGGRLSLNGEASHAEYDSAIRHIEYQYVDARELLLDFRAVDITISDGVAKSAQQSRIIQLIYTFEDLQIPSAFSPNEGDEVNKTWAITSSKGEDLYADAEIKVYNKNGQLLFETRGLKDPWTGVLNGALLPTDTYYYTIDLHYNKVRYKGAVTLLR